jgi:hypothetical protein
MTQSKKEQERILSDIRHFKAMVANEAQLIRDDISKHIAARQHDASATEVLIDRMAEHMAKLNARMQVVETVLISELPVNREVVNQITNTIDAKSSAAIAGPVDPGFPKHVLLNAKHFVMNPNMGMAETTDTGLSYCWTLGQTSTQFTVAICRQKKMQVRIRLVNAVKPELKATAKVLIDGEVIPSRIEFDGTLDCLVADIPSNKSKTDETCLEIRLENTYSPKSLGTSVDERKLGFAINNIEFCEPKKKRRRLIKRG